MKKDIVVVCVIIFILAVVISGTKIQSVDDYYLTHIDEITEDSETVFLTIECKTILDNMDKLDPALKDEKYVPADGVILKRTEYVLRKGDTVFSILDRAVRHNKIHMECIYTEQFGSIYVQGINQLTNSVAENFQVGYTRSTTIFPITAVANTFLKTRTR